MTTRATIRYRWELRVLNKTVNVVSPFDLATFEFKGVLLVNDLPRISTYRTIIFHDPSL